ncbi:MAG: 2-phosphosulfolactate phosphatase [Bacteroidia bacterium]|nr:2-phosphosulfolactate phosphatase [Bacteroidia bacterium]
MILRTSSEFKSDKPFVDVCLSPVFLDHFDKTNAIVVVIDVLRATSSMCIALENGAEKIIPVATIEESMKYKEKGFLVGAERNGLPVAGFDFGNSPFSFVGDNIKGSSIAITTSNGTKAISLAKGAKRIAVASFLNLSAISAWLKEQNSYTIILCSGWKDTFNLEDTLCAGAIVENLLGHFELSINRDAALAAQSMYKLAKDDLYAFLHHSSHAIRLEKLEINDDIKFCLTPDQTDVVPVLQDDALVSVRVKQSV